jgi:nucleotidyltransferase substrate binding protein (TIGR01987 family)
MTQDIRWYQRFENFEKAVSLLREALLRMESLTILEKEGAIQRFEISVELAWKTLKDYLQANGIVVSPGTPKQTIKEAFAIEIIRDGQTWIDMLDLRNLLSHTYNEVVFETAIPNVAHRFLPALMELYEYLKVRKAQ